MPLPTNINQDLAELARMKAALVVAMRPILCKPHHLRTPHERMALSLCRRTFVTCEDYADAVRAERYGSAMIQVRVQLDSCLRFFASLLVADPDGFALRVEAKKKQINEMHDRDGQAMSDGYLAYKLARHQPPAYNWAPRLHKFASDFVHFSGTIMEIAEAEIAGWDETTELEDIDLADRGVPERDWEASMGHFQDCILAFTRLLQGWLADHDLDWP